MEGGAERSDSLDSAAEGNQRVCYAALYLCLLFAVCFFNIFYGIHHRNRLQPNGEVNISHKTQLLWYGFMMLFNSKMITTCFGQ